MLEVGRIGRAVGLRGEVSVTLLTNRTERVTPGAELHCDAGVLRVTSHRTHAKKHIVTFESIKDRTSAEALNGMLLRAEPIDDPDELWAHDLIGKDVIDQHGTNHGEVVAIVANPASDLLELVNGDLIPTHFITTTADQIHVNTPEGLLSCE